MIVKVLCGYGFWCPCLTCQKTGRSGRLRSRCRGRKVSEVGADLWWNHRHADRHFSAMSEMADSDARGYRWGLLASLKSCGGVELALNDNAKPGCTVGTLFEFCESTMGLTWEVYGSYVWVSGRQMLSLPPGFWSLFVPSVLSYARRIPLPM